MATCYVIPPTVGHIALHAICAWLHLAVYCLLGGFRDNLERGNDFCFIETLLLTIHTTAYALDGS